MSLYGPIGTRQIREVACKAPLKGWREELLVYYIAITYLYTCGRRWYTTAFGSYALRKLKQTKRRMRY